MKSLTRKTLLILACLTCLTGLLYPPLNQGRLDRLLIAAMKKDDSASALAALAAGADPNAHFTYENRPHNLWGIVQWAMRDEAIVWHDVPVLTEACDSLKVPVAQALLEKGARINARDKFGLTALISCIEGDHVPITRLLVEHGADVNIQDRNGDTALMRLAANQFSTVHSLPLLLSHGANLTLKNKDGKTALQLAQEAHHLPAVQLLEKAGR